jgi:hypothetical protein
MLFGGQELRIINREFFPGWNWRTVLLQISGWEWPSESNRFPSLNRQCHKNVCHAKPYLRLRTFFQCNIFPFFAKQFFMICAILKSNRNKCRYLLACQQACHQKFSQQSAYNVSRHCSDGRILTTQHFCNAENFFKRASYFIYIGLVVFEDSKYVNYYQLLNYYIHNIHKRYIYRNSRQPLDL